MSQETAMFITTTANRGVAGWEVVVRAPPAAEQNGRQNEYFKYKQVFDYAWFWASVVEWMESALFWNIMQRIVVIP